ncbi:hypothetical protein D3C80_1926500 [compost metagenome]
MTIYLTTFDPDSGLPMGPSADSGFSSLAEVIEAMGKEYRSLTERSVVYEGVAFASYPVRVEP